jgi:hypothetical protein
MTAAVNYGRNERDPGMNDSDPGMKDFDPGTKDFSPATNDRESWTGREAAVWSTPVWSAPSRRSTAPPS